MKNFVKCGVIGWCMELIWTGLHSFITMNGKLTCTTSVWMFPIYGCAALLKPLGRLMEGKPLLLRGSFYAVCIYTFEYFSGMFLKKRGMCPWNYNDKRHNLNGVICFEYFPVWFVAGLIFEKILADSSGTTLHCAHHKGYILQRR